MPRVARKKAASSPPIAEAATPAAPKMVKRETPPTQKSEGNAYITVFAFAFLLGYGLGMYMPLNSYTSSTTMKASTKNEVANATQSVSGTSPIPMLQNFFRQSFATSNPYQYLEAINLNKADKEIVLARARENQISDAYNPAVNILQDARIVIRDQGVSFTIDLNHLDQYAVGVNEGLITDINTLSTADLVREVERIVQPRIYVHTGVNAFEHPIGVLVLASVLQARQHIICVEDKNACPL